MPMPTSIKSKFKNKPDKLIIDLYMDYVEEYTKKLGERTCVVMQVGDFMEMYYYDLPNDTRNKKICDYLCDSLSMRKSKKAKQDYIMAGFPLVAIDKFFSKIVQLNFSLVVIEQTEKDENNKISRFVSNVFSPATDIVYSDNPRQNWMICFYFTSSFI